MDDLELVRRFTYHAPDQQKIRRHQRIRNEALAFARTINETCPDSRELSLAMTALEVATAHANAAIARHDGAMPCTELSATWCPNHGDCQCRPDQYQDDPQCPLHAPDSGHAIEDQA